MIRNAEARKVATATAGGGKVLLAGTDPMVPMVRETLERQGLRARCVPVERAAEAAWLTAPQLIVALGDAVRDGGVQLRDELQREPASASIPLLVVGGGRSRADRGHRHVAMVSASLGPQRIGPLVAALTEDLAATPAPPRGLSAPPLQGRVSASLHRIERRIALPRPGSIPPAASGADPSADPSAHPSDPGSSAASGTRSVHRAPTSGGPRKRAERQSHATVKAADSDEFARCADALLGAGKRRSEPSSAGMDAELEALLASVDSPPATSAAPPVRATPTDTATEEPFVMVEFQDDGFERDPEPDELDNDVAPGTFDHVAKVAPPVVVDSLPAPAPEMLREQVVIPQLRCITSKPANDGFDPGAATDDVMFELDPRDRKGLHVMNHGSSLSPRATRRAQFARAFGLVAMAVASAMIVYGLARHNTATRPASAPQGVLTATQ